jgi:MobA-like NTP transferase domain
MTSAGMPALLVMAAGLGSRYGGLKQIDRVGPAGETLLDYAVFDARRAGFGRVVFIIREEIARDFADLARQFPSDLDVASVHQARDPHRRAPWGTVHAVLAAREAITSPFTTINADDFYGAAAYRLAADACARAGRDGTSAVVGLPVSHTLSEHGAVVRAICQVDREGWITKIDEVDGIRRAGGSLVGHTDCGALHLTGRELASMNQWVFPPEVFRGLQNCFDRFLHSHGAHPTAESLLPQAIDELIQCGAARVRAIESPGPWFGLTHPADRAHVVSGLRALHDRGEYPTPLWGA